MAERKDTTEYIWDYTWLVSIPQLETTSDSYINHFGMPSSGNSAIDKELARQWIKTYRSINEMVEYHRAGIPFKILNMADVQQIYNYVEEHLQGWLYNMKNSLNIGDVPIDDLMALNDFANSLFKYTSYGYKESETNTTFQRAISDMGFANLHARFRPAGATVEKSSWQEEPAEIKRQDLSEDIKKAIRGFSVNDRR